MDAAPASVKPFEPPERSLAGQAVRWGRVVGAMRRVRRRADRHHHALACQPRTAAAARSVRAGFLLRVADPRLVRYERRVMTHEPMSLSQRERQAVLQEIRRTCDFEGWFLHAAHVRSTHVHVVIAAPKPSREGL